MRKTIIALTLLIAPALSLADDATSKLLEQLRDTYKSVKTAHFLVQSKVVSDQGSVDLNSEVFFASPNKINAKLTGFPKEAPVQELVFISDGTDMATLGAPGGLQKKPFTTDLASQRLGFANLETLSFWDYEKQLSTATGNNMEKSELKIVADGLMDGKWFTILEEYAPDQKVLVHYRIDQKTHFIMRTETKNAETKKLIGDSKLTKLELDVKIDDSKFHIGDV